MRAKDFNFIKILSVLGYITIPIWLYFVLVFIPQAAAYDFIEHHDEFTSIMAFIQVIIFWILHTIIVIILSSFILINKNYKVVLNGLFSKFIISIGIILNFIPIIVFLLFVIYLMFLYA